MPQPILLPDHLLHVFDQHLVQYWAGNVVGVNDHYESLVYRQPGTRIYAVEFIRTGRSLSVLGDIGHATYEWSECKDLRWMSRCDLDYWASKCRASPHGAGFESWSEEAAAKWLDNMIQELRDEDAPDDKIQALIEAKGNIDGKLDWYSWLDDDGHDVFGANYIEYANIGMEIDIQCRLQLAALQHAIAALDAMLQALGA